MRQPERLRFLVLLRDPVARAWSHFQQYPLEGAPLPATASSAAAAASAAAVRQRPVRAGSPLALAPSMRTRRLLHSPTAHHCFSI